MIIFPAIDLKNGQVVRLKQGRAEDVTVYSDSPAKQALAWQEQGAEYLHLVDLDGAFTGEGGNFDAVRQIAQALSVPCQLGGGIRDMDKARRVIDAGVRRVIVGTKACENIDFVASLVCEFGLTVSRWELTPKTGGSLSRAGLSLALGSRWLWRAPWPMRACAPLSTQTSRPTECSKGRISPPWSKWFAPSTPQSSPQVEWAPPKTLAHWRALQGCME
ncbi:HisA/HisF-related TIM barrel protein [Kamptonema cortianum]|nr:HisA/HisF-related TIM barrel protein [Kamptonema cortianum]